MDKFQILCVTMNQTDFSKIESMNIHSNVVFANQTNENSYKEFHFEKNTAKMISTNTVGVGKNRNIALLYADAKYCLFADDDVVYKSNVEDIVLKEFKKLPNADVIIFNLNSDDKIRKQKVYHKTRRVLPFEPMPWGCVRIAVRLSSVKKENIWFSTLFGGGCLFPSGEDSMWLHEAKRKGLRIYISNKLIGTVKFENSSWFTGRNRKYYFGQGAFCRANHKLLWRLWIVYYAFRTMRNSELSLFQRIKWLINGADGYNKTISFREYN